MSDPSGQFNTVFNNLSFLSVHRSYNFKRQAILLHGFLFFSNMVVYEYLQPYAKAQGTKLESSYISHFNREGMSPDSSSAMSHTRYTKLKFSGFSR